MIVLRLATTLARLKSRAPQSDRRRLRDRQASGSGTPCRPMAQPSSRAYVNTLYAERERLLRRRPAIAVDFAQSDSGGGSRKELVEAPQWKQLLSDLLRLQAIARA